MKISKAFFTVLKKKLTVLVIYVYNIPRFAKYLSAVLLLFILMLLNVDVVGYIWLNENFENPYNDEKYTFEILREDLISCFKELTPEKIAVELVPEKSEFLSSSLNGVLPSTTLFVSGFNKLLSSLKIQTVIIEPSLLYCILQPKQQMTLLKRKFDISKFLGSKDIITFGILSKDVPVLQEEENIRKFSAAGYQPYFIKTPVKKWMIPQRRFRSSSPFQTVATHIFYENKNFTFHLVVFHERAKYLWHGELENTYRIPPKSQLLFVNHTGAYERFAFIPLESKNVLFANIYIPSMPHYFLFQMLSSRFLECDSSRSANMSSLKRPPKAHPELSVGSFNRRATSIIHQLKMVCQPLLMNLWIWSGTMLGWYRQCDIIPYTTDFDTAAWASEVDDLNDLMRLLHNRRYVTLKHKMGLVEEALEIQLWYFGLQTDIFFMYPVQNGSFCTGHNITGGYYFRFFYPPFTLCSAELLGQKVQVPCETEGPVLSEYGPNWCRPTPSWSYAKSVNNRGPNIYWDANRIKDAYPEYNKASKKR